MQSYSSAVLHEMEIASKSERRLAAQRRALLTREEALPPESNSLCMWLGAGLDKIGERLRTRLLAPRRTMAPDGSVPTAAPMSGPIANRG